METEEPRLDELLEKARVYGVEEEFEQILSEITETGRSETIERIRQKSFEHPIVSMEKFILDPYYLGLEGEIYPKLVDDLIEFFEEGTYFVGIFTGGIGWGKSFCAEVSLARMVYEVGCLRDPQSFYGLASGSKIYFINQSVNKTHAKKVIFDEFKARIDPSEFFKKHFPYNPFLQSELQFPKGVYVMPTASTAALGYNVFGGVIDETNFMPVVENSKVSKDGRVYDHAETLFDAMTRRLKSRFLRQGRVPGKIIIPSAKQYPDDFTERMMKEHRDDPDYFIRDYSQWETKPSYFFLPDRFKVEVNHETGVNRILIGDEDPDSVRGQVVEVPEDYRKDFEMNLEDAIREIAGISVQAISPFIKNRQKIFDCIDEGRVHPYSMETTTLRDGGVIIPKRFELNNDKPDLKPRCVHIDLALTKDAVGFAMGKCDGSIKVIRRDSEGHQYSEDAPLIYIDFMLKIVAPKNGEIILGDVRRLVYQFKEQLGFNIVLVTLDSYESADSIQQFRQKGIASYRVSVDTSMDPYRALKTSFYENRISIYQYQPVINELLGLEENLAKKKVDHRPKGSKDVADALAGVVYDIATNNQGRLTKGGMVSVRSVG